MGFAAGGDSKEGGIGGQPLSTDPPLARQPEFAAPGVSSGEMEPLGFKGF